MYFKMNRISIITFNYNSPAAAAWYTVSLHNLYNVTTASIQLNVFVWILVIHWHDIWMFVSFSIHVRLYSWKPFITERNYWEVLKFQQWPSTKNIVWFRASIYVLHVTCELLQKSTSPPREKENTIASLYVLFYLPLPLSLLSSTFPIYSHCDTVSTSDMQHLSLLLHIQAHGRVLGCL